MTSRSAIDAREFEGLTSRQVEVLQKFADGHSTEDVAALLGISAATVMFHYRQVADRLNTLNRTHTVAEAMKRGLIGIIAIVVMSLPITMSVEIARSGHRGHHIAVRDFEAGPYMVRPPLYRLEG